MPYSMAQQGDTYKDILTFLLYWNRGAQAIKTADFDFYLPEELIAQTPLERRDASRLLVLDKETGATRHMHFF